ncbi:MAG: hypothetical protein AMXMBFR13_00770 [Phycisphaerae bacterium]
MASDEELLRAFANGQRRALGELAERYERPLLNLAVAILGSPDLAVEAVQETWLRVVRYSASFNGRSSVKTWLYRVAINQCRSMRAARPEATSCEPDEPSVERGGTDGVGQTNPADGADRSDQSNRSDAANDAAGTGRTRSRSSDADSTRPQRSDTDRTRPQRSDTDSTRPQRSDTDRTRPQRSDTDRTRPQSSGAAEPGKLMEQSQRSSDCATDPAQAAALSDEIDRLKRAVESLSEPLREVLLVCYTHGMTHEEASATLGIPLGTVKSRLHAALKALRGRMKRHE